MKEAFYGRRELIIGLLEQVPLFMVNRPMGAFYIFPNVSAYFGKSIGSRHIDNADDLAMYLLEEAHVATVSGSAFGEPDCIRISYAASEDEISEAVARIDRAMRKLM